MSVPANLSYNTDDEWWELHNGTATIGITQWGAASVGEIMYAELPAIRTLLVAGQTCGAVESATTAIEVTAPVSGGVVEVNGSLREYPELINEDPYGKGWMFRMHVTDVGAALTAAEYEQLIRLPRRRRGC